MNERTLKRTEPIADDAPHILVVDDDHKIRDLLARFLMENGFRVTAAADGGPGARRRARRRAGGAPVRSRSGPTLRSRRSSPGHLRTARALGLPG